jgi:hypothetical protein
MHAWLTNTTKGWGTHHIVARLQQRAHGQVYPCSITSAAALHEMNASDKHD